MKKVFVFVALVLQTGGVINAQFQFTPHAGISITKACIGPAAGAGAQVGVDVRYSFNGQDKGWALQSGLYYQQQMYIHGTILGYNYQIPGDDAIFATFISPEAPDMLDYLPEGYKMHSIDYINGKYREDYLSLPVMIQYAWKFTPDIRFHLSAGGYFAYAITNRVKRTCVNVNTEDLTQVTQTEYKHRTGLHHWDMGFICQTGLEVKQFAFLVNYQTNLYRRNSGSAYNLASFSVGYTF